MSRRNKSGSLFTERTLRLDLMEGENTRRYRSSCRKNSLSSINFNDEVTKRRVGLTFPLLFIVGKE